MHVGDTLPSLLLLQTLVLTGDEGLSLALGGGRLAYDRAVHEVFAEQMAKRVALRRLARTVPPRLRLDDGRAGTFAPPLAAPVRARKRGDAAEDPVRGRGRRR